MIARLAGDETWNRVTASVEAAPVAGNYVLGFLTMYSAKMQASGWIGGMTYVEVGDGASQIEQAEFDKSAGIWGHCFRVGYLRDARSGIHVVKVLHAEEVRDPCRKGTQMVALPGSELFLGGTQIGYYPNCGMYVDGTQGAATAYKQPATPLSTSGLACNIDDLIPQELLERGYTAG